MLVVGYCGNVRQMLAALRAGRRACLMGGRIVEDRINRRWMQRRLKQAEVDSLLDEILGRWPSGDAA